MFTTFVSVSDSTASIIGVISSARDLRHVIVEGSHSPGDSLNMKPLDT